MTSCAHRRGPFGGRACVDSRQDKSLCGLRRKRSLRGWPASHPLTLHERTPGLRGPAQRRNRPHGNHRLDRTHGRNSGDRRHRAHRPNRPACCARQPGDDATAHVTDVALMQPTDSAPSRREDVLASHERDNPPAPIADRVVLHPSADTSGRVVQRIHGGSVPETVVCGTATPAAAGAASPQAVARHIRVPESLVS